MLLREFRVLFGSSPSLAFLPYFPPSSIAKKVGVGVGIFGLVAPILFLSCREGPCGPSAGGRGGGHGGGHGGDFVNHDCGGGGDGGG